MITKEARAKLFKTFRESSGISISRAARDTETTRDTVRALESAAHDPKESTLAFYFAYYSQFNDRIKKIRKEFDSIARGGLKNGGSRGSRGRG